MGARGRPAAAPYDRGSQRPSHLRPLSPVTGPGGGANYTLGTGLEHGASGAHMRGTGEEWWSWGSGQTPCGPLRPGIPVAMSVRNQPRNS